MKQFIKYLKNIITGAYADMELERYLEAKNATTPESIERLTKEFWLKKARAHGYY